VEAVISLLLSCAEAVKSTASGMPGGTTCAFSGRPNTIRASLWRWNSLSGAKV